MRISRPAGLVGLSLLSALLALSVEPGEVCGQPRTRSGRKSSRKNKTAPPESQPRGAATAEPATAPAASNQPTAAVRLECNDGQASPLCETVQQGVVKAASVKYRVLPPEQVEALMSREPSLRGCRRDECRVAIAEKLGVAQLFDIIVQSTKHRGLLAAVSIFDPIAKGISADTEVQLKREEGRLRRSVEEAVELVLARQRQPALVKLEILPGNTRVKLIDSRGGTRELTDAERDGQREIRLFVDSYTVHVEKPGYIPVDQPLTVTQAGAQLSVRLQAQPVTVKFEWSPPDTKVLIDGDLVSGPDRVMELTEGPHRLEALAPPGTPYESLRRELLVRSGMEPERIVLQRLTELRIKAPRGYSVSVDNKTIPPTRFQERGLTIETAEPMVSGAHAVTATSWRGLQLTQRVSVVPRSSTEVVLKAPPLAPGIVLGSLGVAGMLTGGILLGLDGQCSRDSCVTVSDFRVPGGVMLGVGGALLISGAIWFGYNAANHPAFHKPASSPRE